MLNLFKKYWPLVTLSFILTIIIALNFHPGKIVMGNDNFVPELDPSLTISRSFLNPTWRDNRVLGIPSDSEQADAWRSIIFWIGNLVLPTWIISQGYLFLTLIIGVFSMGKVTQLLNKHSSSALFFGSLLYLFSPITVWIYFYPVHLFVAAYAFTPLVLWTLLKATTNPNRQNKLYLLLSSLIMGTTALTATMFITASFTILSISFFTAIFSKISLKNWLIGALIFILPQLFWILPFTTYVKSNNLALQDSYINREITSTTIQSEQSNNTLWNTLRFSTAWMDTKEDDQSYTYSSRDWFKTNPIGIYLGFIPAVLALIGIISSLAKFNKNYHHLLISLVGFIGWIFLNGYNPPFNQIYEFFDINIPLFHQVFRWGSSKFWPILLIPMLILAVKGIESLINNKFVILKSALALAFACLIIFAVNPVISNSFIRKEVFISIPSTYSSLKESLSDQISLIDSTPHTNTRYFRRHDWGFWGSVFLNYFLPNPTTEKALVIGSYENESAFNALDESYYSGNPTTYINALSRYNISTVLSDQSVTNQGLGSSYSFPYDWNLHDQMVTQNPNLNRTWSQDSLSIYQNKLLASNQAFAVSPNHNYETLNKSLALLNQNDAYVVSQKSGVIFPLSLNPSKIDKINSNLSISSQIPITKTYNFKLSKETLLGLPLLARLQDNQLVISPYYPSLNLNSNPVYLLPSSQADLTSNIVTIGDQIVGEHTTLIEPSEVSNTFAWSTTALVDLTAEIKTVPCNSKGDTPSNKACLSTDHNFIRPSVVSVTTSFNSPTPALVDICLHSYLSNSCLNVPQTFIASQAPQTVTIYPKNIIKPGDNLVVFYVVKTLDSSTPNLDISSLTLSQSTTSKTLPVRLPVFADISENVHLSAGDNLALNLPIASSIPSLQIFNSICPDRGPSNNINKNNNSFTFTTSNCFDGVFSSFSLPKYLDATALLTYVKANNSAGIPLEYNLKQSGVERKVTTDLLSTKSDQDFFKFTLIPNTNQNFTLELVNKGIGQTPSTNTLSDFAAVPIPTSWLSLALTPTTPTSNKIATIQPFSSRYYTGTYLAEITDSSPLYTLPTATSPYWRAVILKNKPNNLLSLYFQVITHFAIHDKILVNGWKDAWSVSSQDQGKYIAIIFFPNVLAYLGLIFGLGIALILVFVRQATKSDGTHKA
jgi:hypothetical protein